ncbi:NAD(P)H-binding protein [Mycetocola zhadangensis]|uniref:NAD(P)H-binding protein n=1 Tax=Mycetocola zhadangensis TaxID=1164595 RepID=UPI0019CB3F38|nr:NAD(P)H-binding protein [Mycetocola zhadangensis]GGF02648.1 hypothetical protein GCM10011313_27220 [Mycetocola zhadangensis]
MQIALTTPRGNVGSHLVRMLIRAGVRPLLLVRHPDGVPEPLMRHVDIAQADSFDPHEVSAATRNVQAIY